MNGRARWLEQPPENEVARPGEAPPGSATPALCDNHSTGRAFTFNSRPARSRARPRGSRPSPGLVAILAISQTLKDTPSPTSTLVFASKRTAAPSGRPPTLVASTIDRKWRCASGVRLSTGRFVCLSYPSPRSPCVRQKGPTGVLSGDEPRGAPEKSCASRLSGRVTLSVRNEGTALLFLVGRTGSSFGSGGTPDHRQGLAPFVRDELFAGLDVRFLWPTGPDHAVEHEVLRRVGKRFGCGASGTDSRRVLPADGRAMADDRATSRATSIPVF